MSQNQIPEHRTGQRFVVAMPVQAEWDDVSSGKHVVTEGSTENVGPDGALVHLPQLPRVGDRITLVVRDEKVQLVRVAVEVIRLERNAAHPLAALQLLKASAEWRGRVWETAGVLASTPDENDYED
ncbi:MAG: PilZ domain-containing protein [Pyrinomonadaceae bacterium MAG19_C2-C3]|nr:PilZ domain-containing protein [Pyrinomonadaceae bacterium MAG19_C2-C3]